MTSSSSARPDPEVIWRLAAHGRDLVLAHQAATGAYPASPTFAVYRFAWLRDGAFIAEAMSRLGETASAEAFFAWCARVVESREEAVEALVRRLGAGGAGGAEALAPGRCTAADLLPARFTLEGATVEDGWGDQQLDGYGAWLWALDAHRQRHGRSVEPYLRAALLTARYLAVCWSVPCYDWWEERPEGRHVATLAAVRAGLLAVAGWPEVAAPERAAFAAAAAAIERRVREEAGLAGRLVKTLGGSEVDASLLAALTPFQLLAPDEPLAAATLAAVVGVLVRDGGVHRYPGDTYYGGGQWLPLAGFLGWHALAVGRGEAARTELAWMADQATPAGELPEQVPAVLLDPASYGPWVERWGPIATPLLWSHAMFLVLADELGMILPVGGAGVPG